MNKQKKTTNDEEMKKILKIKATLLDPSTPPAASEVRICLNA